MPPKYYCSKCNKIVETYVKDTEETYKVKGELEVTLFMPVRHCKVCNERIPDTELDNNILKEAYRIYEEKTGQKVRKSDD